MKKWKFGLSSMLLGFMMLVGMIGNPSEAEAATKVFHNKAKEYSMTIPMDWGFQDAGDGVEMLYSGDQTLMIVTTWESMPRKDKHGTYLFDEVQGKESYDLLEDIKGGFLSSFGGDLKISEASYIKLNSGRTAVFMEVNHPEAGPMVGLVLFRGNEALLMLGAGDNARRMARGKEQIIEIFMSLKA
jgi:hypothetical protein